MDIAFFQIAIDQHLSTFAANDLYVNLVDLAVLDAPDISTIAAPQHGYFANLWITGAGNLDVNGERGAGTNRFLRICNFRTNSE